MVGLKAWNAFNVKAQSIVRSVLCIKCLLSLIAGFSFYFGYSFQTTQQDALNNSSRSCGAELEEDLLPLMFTLDFYDIIFFIRALKQPSSHFNIYDYISFSTANTRSSSSNKLNHIHSSNNYTRNFYFNRITRLWNKLPIIDLSLSPPTIKLLKPKYITIFTNIL